MRSTLLPAAGAARDMSGGDVGLQMLIKAARAVSGGVIEPRMTSEATQPVSGGGIGPRIMVGAARAVLVDGTGLRMTNEAARRAPSCRIGLRTTVEAARAPSVNVDLRPKKVFSLGSELCLIPRRCLVAVARDGGPEFASTSRVLTVAQCQPTANLHVLESDVSQSLVAPSTAVSSSPAAGASMDEELLAACRAELREKSALCEEQQAQIESLRTLVAGPQLLERGSEEIRGPTVPPPVSHTCKLVVHGFAQGISNKHAYTVQFTEFVQSTLRIRCVPILKVQQLVPSTFSKNGLSFAVVLLKTDADVERILMAAAQYLDTSDCIRIDRSSTKATRVARASAMAQQGTVVHCAWQARRAVTPLYQGSPNQASRVPRICVLNADAATFVQGRVGHVIAQALRTSHAVSIINPAASAAITASALPSPSLPAPAHPAPSSPSSPAPSNQE